jgi:hypothetical protein
MIRAEGGTMRVIYTRLLITGVLLAALAALGTLDPGDVAAPAHAAAHP